MNRRKFLLGASTVSILATSGTLSTTVPAQAFVVTLAAVAKVASIAASVLGMFSKGSNPSAQVMLENYKLLLQVHEKLDQLEKLIIEVLSKINALPKVLQKEIEDGSERKLNKQIISIVRSFKEDIANFEAAAKSDNADRAYEIFKLKTQANLTQIQNLRNELSFYSNFSLMALAGSAITEIAMYVLLGGKPEELPSIRKFFRELIAKHEDPKYSGSLAQQVANLGAKYGGHHDEIRNLLTSFPAKGAPRINLVDGRTYLDRCKVYGYAERVHGKTAFSTQGVPFARLYLNKFFDRHENQTGRKKWLKRDMDSFKPMFTLNSRVRLHRDEFVAGGRKLPLLRTSQRPESIHSAGDRTSENKPCPKKVYGRPNVIDKAYNAHVSRLYAETLIHNKAAEAYGVMLEYQVAVRKSYGELFAYFDKIGIPK